MKLLPRTTTINPIIVKENGGKPYSTGYYDTHIKRKICCGHDPDLYGGEVYATFLKEAAYFFKCAKCGRKGKSGISWNAAAASWNETYKDN